MNRVRQHPAAFAAEARAMLPLFDQAKLFTRPGQTPVRTREGAAAVHELVAFLDGARPVPPFESCPAELCEAARRHVRDIGASGATAHEGSDGSSSQDRVEACVEWERAMGENLAFGTATAADIVAQLCVDDGVPSRGHRANVFNPEFKHVGVAVGAHARYGTMACIVHVGGWARKDASAPAKLRAPLTVTATAMGEQVARVLGSIPFEGMRTQVEEAFAQHPPHEVTLEYAPGSIVLRIKSAQGLSTAQGTWE
jgi:hypothetical protein